MSRRGSTAATIASGKATTSHGPFASHAARAAHAPQLTALVAAVKGTRGRSVRDHTPAALASPPTSAAARPASRGVRSSANSATREQDDTSRRGAGPSSRSWSWTSCLRSTTRGAPSRTDSPCTFSHTYCMLNMMTCDTAVEVMDTGSGRRSGGRSGAGVGCRISALRFDAVAGDVDHDHDRPNGPGPCRWSWDAAVLVVEDCDAFRVGHRVPRVLRPAPRSPSDRGGGVGCERRESVPARWIAPEDRRAEPN